MVIIETHTTRVGFIPPGLGAVYRLVMLIVVCVFSSQALAHDPGLSAVELNIRDQSISVDLTLARRDIELLHPIDLDADGQISEYEITESETQLLALALNMIELETDDRRLNGTVLGLEYDVSDALRLSIKYPRVPGVGIRFSAPIIPRLALGHRQFVTVRQDGEVVQSAVLSASSNEMNIGVQPMGLWRQSVHYLHEGIWHIWIGFDHILFLIAMLLPAALVLVDGRWLPRSAFKPTVVQVVKIVSAFTLAHSITLALAVFNLIRLNPALVESAIAASVIFAAINNVRPFVQDRIWLMAFVFGLIHGLGFASVLSELSLPGDTQGIALLGFNLGVELGQLAIVAAMLPCIYTLRNHFAYRVVLMRVGSVAIAVVACVWLMERAAGLNLVGA